MKRLRFVVMALLLAVIPLPLGGLPAAADPGVQQNPAAPAPAPAPDALVLGWRQLGLSDTLEIDATAPATVEAPTPPGLAPVRITGEIGSPLGGAGRIDIMDRGGSSVGSIAVPPDGATAPFTVNIAAAAPSPGPLKLSFIQRGPERPADGCAEPAPVTLSKLATTYTGRTPDLRTVADFIPDYLDQITILIGPEPSLEQQQAALTLVAKLTHLYRPMPVRIDVDTSATTLPTAALPAAGDSRTRRTIAIQDGDQPGLAVENPGSPAAVLVISGSGAELTRQVELFTDRRFELAQTPTAAVTSVTTTVPTSTDTLSFGELGINIQTTVMGTDTVYVGVDTTKFGLGQLDGAQFRLIAEYTPVISGEGSVIVRSGSDILASGVLDRSGVAELSGDIPAANINSIIGMALEIRYAPAGGECAFGGMTFSIDPASTITVVPGAENRGGFAMLPMAFTPELDVAIEGPDQIRFAAQAINLIGRQASVPLQPSLASLDEAAKRGSGLLAVTSGEQLQRVGLRPPLLMPGASAVGVNGATVTDVDLGGSLGVVQAFAHNGRVVLAIDSTGGPQAADRSLAYIRGLDGGWSALNGDVVATGDAGEVVNLSMTTRQGMAPPVGDGWRWWTWSTFGLIAVGLPALACIALVRRRRAQRNRVVPQ
jgi:hypothetical protein